MFLNYSFVEKYANKLANKELSYKKENVIEEGRNVIKNQVPKRVMEMVKDDYEENAVPLLNERDIQEYFKVAMEELEPEEGYRSGSLLYEDEYREQEEELEEELV